MGKYYDRKAEEIAKTVATNGDVILLMLKFEKLKTYLVENRSLTVEQAKNIDKMSFEEEFKAYLKHLEEEN